MRQAAAFVIALAALSTCMADAGSPRFGIALLGPAGCASFPAPPPGPGQDVLLVLFDPPRWMPARLAARRSTPCRLQGLQEAFAYELRLPHGQTAAHDIAIAVIAPGAQPDLEQEGVVLRTPGPAAPITLRRCASREGLHLRAWQRGRPLWQEYVLLGYDIEPTCPPGPAAAPGSP